MKTRPTLRPARSSRLSVALAFIAATRGPKLCANPQGVTVVSGSASTQQSGSRLNVTVGQTTFLNWNSFDIQAGETTRFIQPNSRSIVFNSIGGASPSQIWGNLVANGTVILANAHGFYFGPNSMINVGGSFIATTAPLAPDVGGGSSWQFTGLPPLASIVNYGQIEAGHGKSLFLIAEKIENHGDLLAPGGDIGLYAGKQVLVSERPDGRGLSATVNLPSGSVDNFGQITADAGTISLQAQVVNQSGILRADSVQNHNGVIELVASDSLNLGASSQILARGDDTTAGSAAGTVTLKSDSDFSDVRGSHIATTGGAHGGDGGNVEVSAANILSLNSTMDAGAQTGWTGGKLMLDPLNITLGTTGSGGTEGGSVGYDSGSGTLALNVNRAFANKNFSAIDLQATANITLQPNTVWNLSQSTGVNAGQLTLQAGGDIVFNNGSQIVDANYWSVNLQAGVSFPSGTIQSGVGNIFLNGGSGATLSGSISTAGGSINLSAGNSILVGSGSVRTTAGGSITAGALAGDINAGTANGGYQFSILGYSVSPNLGGISTTAGGDVDLSAGHNIVSTPTVPAGQPPGASGAYGGGNVTLSAGNQVLGNYLVANGVGTILAGVQVQNGHVTQVTSAGADVGSSQRPVNLSLITGAWDVFAAQDAFVGEVRNPNGTFNSNHLNVPGGEFSGNTGNPTVPARSAFLFDYAPDAAASFWAGNSITLAGSNLPRVTGQNEGMPPIYPPILNLDAGAGGINILNSLLLYPSSQGALHITTRDGGSLIGAVNSATLTGITMSDSSLPDWTTFSSGHAAVPLHLNDPHPVTLDVSGGIQSFGLAVPTFAEIHVARDTYNFGFSGRNLSPSQTTSIQVAGDLAYRGDLTSVALTDPLPASLLNPGLSGDSSVAAKLSYNSTTGTLTFVGQMSSSDLSFLLHPTQVVLDASGRPVLDSTGNPVTTAAALSATQTTAINQLYALSQSASLGDQGITLSGPGAFNVSARDIDLGISGGISVLGPDSALAAISPYGANLAITTSGNLDMTSTKIANDSVLGGITLTVGGKLDVGGQFTTFGDPNAAKGILTTSGGSISVTASGNVNVDGSRIAAYNGGNILVVSQHGDVNAGAGGSGFVSMTSLELDPVTHQLISLPASIPGSGILATTLAGSIAPVLGNITVNAPKGSINASLGGIVQIAFNGADARNALIDLNAGQDINATGSGVIGSNVKLQAGGNVNGIVVGSGDVAINAQHNVDVTAFGGASVAITAVGGISGTIISGGAVNVSGDSISAALVAGSVSTSGDASKAQVGMPTSTVAKDEAVIASDATTISKAAGAQPGDEEDKKKKGKTIALMHKVGRVTVLLPQKN